MLLFRLSLLLRRSKLTSVLGRITSPIRKFTLAHRAHAEDDDNLLQQNKENVNPYAAGFTAAGTG